MTIFLFLLLSATQDRIMAFLLVGSNVVTGIGGVSIFTFFETSTGLRL
jgi:hypothetical protein